MPENQNNDKFFFSFDCLEALQHLDPRDCGAVLHGYFDFILERSSCEEILKQLENGAQRCAFVMMCKFNRCEGE